MLQWINYTFYKEEYKGPIDSLSEGPDKDQTITASCESHDTILIGTNVGNLYTYDGADLSPSNTVVVEQGSEIQSLISPPYCQELLISIRHDDQDVLHIKPNFAEPEGCDIEYYPVGGHIKYISGSAKLSRIVYTTDLRTIYMLYRKVPNPTLPERPTINPNIDGDITGLYVTNDQDSRKHIFVTFAHGPILCYHLNVHNATEKKQLDTAGCLPGASCLTDSGNLVVCRNNKITIFSRDGKDREIDGFDVSPRLISWSHKYLVFASRAGACFARIYDLDTHCSYCSVPHGDKLQNILTAFGCIVFIYNDKTWICESERDTDFKVNTLCGHQQYAVALKIAESARMSPAWIANIHRRIGDSRYEHHSYEESVQEYAQAIGYLEPSYVITKFLEPQHAEFLCTYLEALHEKNQATPLHSTLLFNCLTKLRRVESIKNKIDQAIKTISQGKAPSFDIGAAASVLDSSGFDYEALRLTTSFRLYRKTVKIFFEHENYDEALATLRISPAGDCEHSIVKFGQDFLDHATEKQKEDFTRFCADVCITGLRNADKEDLGVGVDPVTRQCDPELILPIFAQHQKYCFTFLTTLIREAPSRMTEKLWNNAIQSAIICDVNQLPMIMRHQNANYSQEQALIALKEQLYELEGLLTKKAKDPSLDIDVESQKHQVRLLKEALTALYEKRGLYYEILVQADYSEVLNICNQYGAKDQNLWTDGLLLLVGAKQFDYVPAVIAEIRKRNILSFIEVTSILSNTVRSTYNLIQDYALETIEKLQNEIENEENELKEIDEEIEKKESEMQKLKTKPFVIKPNMKCPRCNMTIETPCVHFLCGHSYHSRCLGEKADVCSQCSRIYEETAKLKLDENDKARKIDDLLNEFEKQPDAMSLLETVLSGQVFSPDLDNPTDEVVSFFLQRVTE
jgi:hypothetical protein